MMDKIQVSTINIEGIEHPIYYRPQTVDKDIVKVIFEGGCYILSRGTMSPPCIENFEPKFIIDGGANIGGASVFFANRYPTAEIVAIEPEEENFKLLKYNAEAYPKVKPIHAALWHRDKKLAVGFGDLHCGPSGYMTSEGNDVSHLETTRGITIEKIFRESGFDYIDILKLDIEGAEKEIFSEDGNYQSWLPYVKVLIVELHDRMKRGCSRNLFRAMSWYKYFFMIADENLIFIREDLL